MTDLKEKRKKQEQLEIAERKVKKATVRAAKAEKKLKKAKKLDTEEKVVNPIKDEVSEAHKRLHRNLKIFKKIKDKLN